MSDRDVLCSWWVAIGYQNLVTGTNPSAAELLRCGCSGRRSPCLSPSLGEDRARSAHPYGPTKTLPWLACSCRPTGILLLAVLLWPTITPR